MDKTLEKLWKNLTKSDYKIILMIYFYAIFIYKYNSFLLTTGHWKFFYSTSGILLVTSVVIVIVLRSIYKQKTAMTDWGLRLDKQGWLFFVFCFLFMLGLAIVQNAPFVSITSVEFEKMIAPTTSVFGQELILRAFLISFLIKVLGKENKEIILAVVISSLVIAFVQKPFLEITEQHNTFYTIFFWAIFYGYAYYMTKSILVPILFSAFQKVLFLTVLFPGAPDNYLFYPDMLNLSIYLLLAGICVLITKKLKLKRRMQMLE